MQEENIGKNIAVPTNNHPMGTRGNARITKPNSRYLLLTNPSTPTEPKQNLP